MPSGPRPEVVLSWCHNPQTRSGSPYSLLISDSLLKLYSFLLKLELKPSRKLHKTHATTPTHALPHARTTRGRGGSDMSSSHLVCLASHHGVSAGGCKTQLGATRWCKTQAPTAASARSQDFQSAEVLRLPTEGVGSTEPDLTTEVVSWV